MQKEFIQGLLDEAVKKRVFAGFPELKGLDDSSKAKLIDSFKKNPILETAKNTNQPLPELREMMIESFLKATNLLKSNAESILKEVFPDEEFNDC
ncbi:MAG: hypothetical protein QG674_256 [Patescibacteria group bacterium]|jgi:hypothetical protein|nr:hypothetical protein [Patescibacteria group bacterium]